MNNYNQVFTDTLHTNNVISENNIINIGNKSNDKSNIETNINNNEDTLNIDNINLKNNITFKDEKFKNNRTFNIDNLIVIPGFETFIQPHPPESYGNNWDSAVVDPNTNTAWYEKPRLGQIYYSVTTAINNKYNIYGKTGEDAHKFLEGYAYYLEDLTEEPLTFKEIELIDTTFSSLSSCIRNTFYIAIEDTSVSTAYVTSKTDPTSHTSKQYYHNIYYYSRISGTSTKYYWFYEYRPTAFDFGLEYIIDNYYMSVNDILNSPFTVEHLDQTTDNNIDKFVIYKYTNDNPQTFTEQDNILEENLLINVNKLPYIIEYTSTNPKCINVGKTYNNNFGEIFNDYNFNEASGSFAHSEGYQSKASGNYSHTEGFNNVASNTSAHAEGSLTFASGLNSHAEGYSTIASGARSHAEGYSSKATGSYTHAEGYASTASGNYSHSEGRNTTSSGTYSHAQNYYTIASGNYSHASGCYTYADKPYMTAIGKYNVYNSKDTSLNTGKLFVVGNGTATTSRNDAFVVKDTGDVIVQTSLITPEIKTNTAVSSTEGNITTNEYSLNIGKKSSNQANITTTIEETNNSGTISITDQYDTLNIDKINTSSLTLNYELIGVQRSTNPGNDDKLIATKAYVLENSGSGGSDIGQLYPGSTHGEIFNNYDHNVAEGNYSHAEGYYTNALSNYSFAGGYYTYSNQPYMFVIGKYNLYDQNHPEYNVNKLFVVGNGDQNTRSDAFVVKDDGSVLINDKITINKISQSYNYYGSIILKDNSNNEKVKLDALNGLTLNSKSTNDIQQGTNTSHADNKILTSKKYVDESISSIDLTGYVQKNTQNTIGADHIFSGNLTLSGTNTFSGSSNTFNNVIYTNGGIKTNTTSTDLKLSSITNNITMNIYNNNTPTLTFDVANGKITNNKVSIEKSGTSNISGQIQIKDKNDNVSITLKGDDGITTEKLNMVDIDSSTTPPANITINNIKKGNSNNNTLVTKGYVDDELSGKANLNGADFTGNISTSGTITSTGLITANNGLSIPSNKLLSLNSKSVNDIELGTDTTNNNIITTKSYVDEQINSIDLSNYVTKTTTQIDISGQKTFSNPSNSYSGSFNGSLTTSSITLNSNELTDTTNNTSSTEQTTKIITTKNYVDNGLSNKFNTSDIITSSSTTSSSDNTIYSSSKVDSLLSNSDNKYIRKDQADSSAFKLTLSNKTNEITTGKLKLIKSNDTSNTLSIEQITPDTSSTQAYLNDNNKLYTKGKIDNLLSSKADASSLSNYVLLSGTNSISATNTFSGSNTFETNNVIINSGISMKDYTTLTNKNIITKIVKGSDNTDNDTLTTKNYVKNVNDLTNYTTTTNSDTRYLRKDQDDSSSNKLILSSTSNEITIGQLKMKDATDTSNTNTITKIKKGTNTTDNDTISTKKYNDDTYQTISGMSNYLTTSEASTTYASLTGNNTFIGTNTFNTNNVIVNSGITTTSTNPLNIKSSSSSNTINFGNKSSNQTKLETSTSGTITDTFTTDNIVIEQLSLKDADSTTTPPAKLNITQIKKYGSNNNNTLTTQGYVDNKISSSLSNYVTTDNTVQTITGQKTFNNSSNSFSGSLTTSSITPSSSIINLGGKSSYKTNLTTLSNTDTFTTDIIKSNTINNSSGNNIIKFTSPSNVNTITIGSTNDEIELNGNIKIKNDEINAKKITIEELVVDKISGTTGTIAVENINVGSITDPSTTPITQTIKSSIDYNGNNYAKKYVVYSGNSLSTTSTNERVVVNTTDSDVNGNIEIKGNNGTTNIKLNANTGITLSNSKGIILNSKKAITDTTATDNSSGNEILATKYYVDSNNIGKLYPESTHGEIFNNYNNNQATGNYSHAEGANSIASGDYSHAEGFASIASGYCSHAEGVSRTTASGHCSHAEGIGTTASGDGSHSEGSGTIASGNYSHAEGGGTITSGNYSHASGYNTYADKENMFVCGKYNIYDENTPTLNDGKLFVIGNGEYNEISDTVIRSDAFVVYDDGNTYVQNNLFVGEEVDSNGSDYAELFESYNNLTKDDFKGKFITLEEDDKVRIANNNDDYILGVYSFHPSVLGNNPIDYPDKYLRNEFTEIIYEDIKQLKQEFIDINNKKKNNDELTDEEIELDKINEEDKYEIIKKPKLNDKYNDKLKYIQRKDRDNWIPVGMLGKLLVIDNGTCQVNKFCKISNDGTAIPYDRKDGNIPHYRVIKRNNDKTIFIIFK